MKSNRGYSSEPAPAVKAAAERFVGLSRQELHAIRNAAIVDKDLRTMLATTYAMSLLPLLTPLKKSR